MDERDPVPAVMVLDVYCRKMTNQQTVTIQGAGSCGEEDLQGPTGQGSPEGGEDALKVTGATGAGPVRGRIMPAPDVHILSLDPVNMSPYVAKRTLQM